MITVLLVQLIRIYSLILFVYVVLSWIPSKGGWLAAIDEALARICEPYLKLFRKIMPPIGGMVDITPIIAYIALQIISSLILFLF